MLSQFNVVKSEEEVRGNEILYGPIHHLAKMLPQMSVNIFSI